MEVLGGNVLSGVLEIMARGEQESLQWGWVETLALSCPEKSRLRACLSHCGLRLLCSVHLAGELFLQLASSVLACL